jgi:hypothetical protein
VRWREKWRHHRRGGDRPRDAVSSPQKAATCRRYYNSAEEASAVRNPRTGPPCVRDAGSVGIPDSVTRCSRVRQHFERLDIPCRMRRSGVPADRRHDIEALALVPERMRWRWIC